MRATKNNKDLFKFFQKTKNSFINVCTNEVETPKSVKIQFSLLVKFYMIRDEKVEEINHYFNRMQPVTLNEHNIDILNPLLNQFIDEVKGQIEAWSERGSGWIMHKILEAFINVAQYRPLRGGSYMVLPTTLKNKRAILNIQNRDNQCLRWSLRAALFPAPRGRNSIRPSSYPIEDGLNFTGIDFPTPVSQIDRLERQNPNLAINVFGWENGHVVVHRISEKGGETPRINLMITKQGENTHLLVPNFKDSVRDHDHMTGKYRGAAHNECNFKLKLNPKTMPIPVIFHNLKGYDGHLLMQAMARVRGEIKCIPTNTEKYNSFSLGNLRFVDSVNYQLSSLDKLVKGSDEFPIMQRRFPEENMLRLLLKKGIYPYEYMDSFERFHETQLPEKEKFYSSISGQGIKDEEYAHAKQVWETIGCRNLGDYHNLYVETDTMLLADVFENFRKVCQEKDGLDPAHYYSAPGLSWDALMK